MMDLFGGETRVGIARRPKNKPSSGNQVSSNDDLQAQLEGLWEFAKKVTLLYLHEDRIVSIVSTHRVDCKRSGQKSAINHEYMITLCFLDGIGCKTYMYSKGKNTHAAEDQFARDLAKEFLNRPKLKTTKT